MIHPNHEILLNSKKFLKIKKQKNQATDTSNNVDESQKHYAKYKKLDTKEYLLYVSTDITF